MECWDFDQVTRFVMVLGIVVVLAIGAWNAK